MSFTIVSPFPNEDKIRYQNYFGKLYNKIDIHKEVLTASFLSIMHTDKFQLCKQILLSPASLIKSMFRMRDYLNFLAAHDKVIDVSRDAIGKVYGIPCVVQKLTHLYILLNSKRKFIFAPQSFGPFTYTKILFKNRFEKTDKIYARDTIK